VLLNSRGEVVYKQIIIRIIGRRTNLILSLWIPLLYNYNNRQ
jgi:hypothetical protein